MRIALASLALLAACGSSGRALDSADSPAPAPVAPPPVGPAATPPPVAPLPPSDGCTDGDAICVAKDRRRACVNGSWTEQTCAAGSGCFAGACTPGKCADECTLGATQAGKTCAPWSVATAGAGTSDATTKLHDRARAYLMWLEKSGILAGGVTSPVYADPPAYTTITTMNGVGDSALWTGTLLGAQALRLRATGAPDARARVRELAATMHLWLNVAGEPGMLVRYAKDSSKTFPFTLPDVDCSSAYVHCGIDHAGTKYDFLGHISRDQYQGVMLGLALAYDALDAADEDVRETIRGDVVVVVKELMKERMLPLAVTYNGIALPVTTVPARFLVVSPREMTNGAATVTINSGGSDKLGSMAGFQEFTPDLRDLLKYIPGIGALAVLPLPRPSSAIMLASFFRVALHVTDGVPAWAKDHADILAYYTGHTGEGGNVSDWLAIANQWTDNPGCGASYYGNNITMQPLYDLARLEDDPARLSIVRDQVLGQKLWPAFAPTKNVFFSFLYAGVTPGAPSSVASSAADQLAQFPPPPRVQVAVDLRSSPKYAMHATSCADQVSHDTAVDVGDRVPSDFLWQRQPWGLYDPGNPAQTQPGVDYLVAYFLGLRHGFLIDDTPGTCLAWQ